MNTNKKFDLRIFDKVLLGILSLMIIVDGFALISAYASMDDIYGPNFGLLSKLFSFVKVLYIVGLAIFLFLSYVRTKQGGKFASLVNIVLSAGFIIYFLNFIISNPLYKMVKAAAKVLGSAQSFDAGGMYSGGVEALYAFDALSDLRLALIGIFLIISPIVMLIGTVIFGVRVFTGKNVAISGVSKETLSQGFDKAKSGVSDLGSKFDPENFQDYDEEDTLISEEPDHGGVHREYGEEEYSDYDQVDHNQVQESPSIDIDSKKILMGLGAIVGLVVLAFVGRTLVENSKPDAVVDNSEMYIEINIEGTDGYGHAEAWVDGIFEITDVKEDMDASHIDYILIETPVELSKSENLKNGDVIEAIVKFESPDYKVEFAQDEIKLEYTVQDLDTVISTIDEVPEDVIKRMEDEAVRRVANDLGSRRKELKIDRLDIFQQPVDEDALKSLSSGDESPFSIIVVVLGQYRDLRLEKMLGRTYTYRFYNIQEQNGAYIYDISDGGYDDAERYDELVNYMIYQGYISVPEYSEDLDKLFGQTAEENEPEDEPEEEEKFDATALSEKKIVELLENNEEEIPHMDELLKELEKYMQGATKYVKDVGNLRDAPNTDNSNIRAELGDGAKVEIYDTTIEKDRVWGRAHVTDTDGEEYEGWISHRVLKF